MIGFFGRSVAPGAEGGQLVCAGESRVLRLSNVALALDAPKGARASLVVRVADHDAEEEDEEEMGEDAPLPIREFVVCTLTESRPDTTIELFFMGREIAELAVVGNAAVHVTGSVSYVEEGAEGDNGDGPYPDFDEDEDAEDDEEMDSEEEADLYGAEAVHKRDAAKTTKTQRASAKKALPSLMAELAEDGDSDEADQSEYSFHQDDDEDDEDEDDDDEDMDDFDDEDMDDEDDEEEDLTNAEVAEKKRQALKGKIEVVESPKPSPKLAPSQPSSQQQQQQAKKRKPEDGAASTSPKVQPQQTPAKKQKTAAPSATPAGGSSTPGAFKCNDCDRAFGLEGALKQHVTTKHGQNTPAKTTTAAANAASAKKK